MEVWVLLWEYPSDGDSNATVWFTKKAAQKQALEEISEHIDTCWDMDDPVQEQRAGEIDELEEQGQLHEAIEKWNEYQSEEDYGQFYKVIKCEVQGGEVTSPPVEFKASTPGATCRGQCKQYSNTAYADRSDGTYECYQCKTFGHIFGTSKP